MFINKVIHKIKSTAANYEFGLLKNRAKHYGYDLVADKLPEPSEIFINNFFKTSHPKNALLSYLTYPFAGNTGNYHSNNRECYTMGEIMNELGYNVDVISWDNTAFLPKKKYDLVIDNHNNLERLRHYFEQSTTRIFHATNAHWLYQNSVEYDRCYQFFTEQGIAVAPSRLMPRGNSAEHCDAISMFGNEFTKSTYGRYSDKVYHLPVSVTCEPELIERDYSFAKKKFLWLNSHGALLKGLDVVLQAFSIVPQLELYVCGNLERDGEFKEAVSEQLSNASNIKVAGWVDIEGEVFKRIASECAWVISTSFSEGGGGSVLNCMAKGLIPVVSKTASITLQENTGFYIEENNAKDVAALLSTISTLSDTDLSRMSYNAHHFVASNHTTGKFKEKYKEFILQILARPAHLFSEKQQSLWR